LFAVVVVLALCARGAAGEDIPAVTVEGVPPAGEAVDRGCQNCGDEQCGPGWSVYSDALFLHRSAPGSRVLITDSFGPNARSLLNADEFNPGVSAGWDIDLMRRNILGSAWSLEGNYFGLDDWNATRGVERSDANIFVWFIHPLYSTGYPVDVSASYRSALHSVELNAWRPLGDWGSLLIGFRYLDLSENSLDMYATIVGPPPNPAVIRVDADNCLSGFQLGFDRLLWSRNRWSLEGCAKAGIYDNHATNGVLVTQIGPQYACSATTDHAAFVGDLTFTAKYAITANLSLRGGYQLLWIDGVALAPDQIAVSDPGHGRATVCTSAAPFYQGAFVGLEWQR
jgi:hypothetical protein